jgi:hypothetical protein
MSDPTPSSQNDLYSATSFALLYSTIQPKEPVSLGIDCGADVVAEVILWKPATIGIDGIPEWTHVNHSDVPLFIKFLDVSVNPDFFDLGFPIQIPLFDDFVKVQKNQSDKIQYPG